MKGEARQIDWAEVKERLARAAGHRSGEERARRALQERARALAVPPSTEVRRVEAAVAFEAAGGRFALAADRVLRVERARPPAPLPGAPRFVLGLVPVAGRPWLLLDVAALLGPAPPRTSPPRWAVLLAAPRAEMALAADAVQLMDLAPDELHPTPDPERVRRGLTADARLVLDAAALLDRAAALLRGPGGPTP
jgi:purine-binding chemotaxis protein CheW